MNEPQKGQPNSGSFDLLRHWVLCLEINLYLINARLLLQFQSIFHFTIYD